MNYLNICSVYNMDYNIIYEIWEKESTQDDLIKLEQDFFKEFSKMFHEFYTKIEEFAPDSTHRKLLEKEIENLKMMVKSIYEIRFNKILNAVKNGIEIDISYLTENELNLYNKIKAPIHKYVQNIDLLLEGQSFEFIKNKIKSKFIIVRFLEDLPELVGTDNNTYGPFKINDIAVLPRKMAEPLLERGAAKFIPILSNLNEC